VEKFIGDRAPKDFIQWHLTVTDKLLLFKPVTSVTVTEFEESFGPPLPLPTHLTLELIVPLPLGGEIVPFPTAFPIV